MKSRSEPKVELDADFELRELQICLEEARTLECVDQVARARLSEKIAEHAFNLVVAGEFKRGKSTVINALVGADLLPTGVVPSTSVVTRLQYAQAPAITVILDSGEHRAVGFDALPDYVTERGNPRNAKSVREVCVGYPAEWLRGGIRIIDTPGIGSAHVHNTDVTYRYLPQADAVIFVMSVDQPASRAELDFLVRIRRYAKKVFCVLNKLDHLSAAELSESMAFATQAIGDALGTPIPVFPFSARFALEGRTAHDPDLIARSRFAEFDDSLRRFLLDEGGGLWAHSVRRNLLRLVSDAKLSIDLELTALTTPLESLDAKLQTFAAKKREALQAKSDLDLLLGAEARKLTKEIVEPNLASFARALVPQLYAAVDARYADMRGERSAALHAALEEVLVAQVSAAFDAWRAETDAVVSAAFERLCQRFWENMQESIDSLQRHSAELFSVPYAAVTTASLWVPRNDFYYKFWREPPGLMTLTHGLMHLLPGRLAHPFVLHHARRRADDLADAQVGRLRHDFEERIKNGVRGFRRELLDHIEMSITAIENAIDKGRALRTRSDDSTAPRRQQLEVSRARVAALEVRLAASSSTASMLHVS